MPKTQAVEEIEETPKPKKAKPAPEPEPEPEYVTSAQLAAQIGIKSTILRRWLRTLEQYQDGGYTRYKWEPDDPFLKTAQEHYEKFAQAEADKQTKRIEEARAKAEKKKAAADAAAAKPKKIVKGKAKAAEEEEPEEDEVFEEEAEEEESEEELE